MCDYENFPVDVHRTLQLIPMQATEARANSFGSNDFHIQLRAHEFISNLVVGISELVFWRY